MAAACATLRAPGRDCQLLLWKKKDVKAIGFVVCAEEEDASLAGANRARRVHGPLAYTHLDETRRTPVACLQGITPRSKVSTMVFTASYARERTRVLVGEEKSGRLRGGVDPKAGRVPTGSPLCAGAALTSLRCSLLINHHVRQRRSLAAELTLVSHFLPDATLGCAAYIPL